MILKNKLFILVWSNAEIESLFWKSFRENEKNMNETYCLGRVETWYLYKNFPSGLFFHYNWHVFKSKSPNCRTVALILIAPLSSCNELLLYDYDETKIPHNFLADEIFSSKRKNIFFFSMQKAFDSDSYIASDLMV